ncbi:unnamed protein product [Paramecium octaurelia]|uniref:Uncharacterized protein n=1 Tax=Paramecium octaurelia TaxID=43137 RepID=A0A8S1XYL4_PAROT|nr:unnamed protein product [Paramecium octaurelia]
MKKEQEYPKLLNKNEEKEQIIEEPHTVLINPPFNLLQTQNIFVFEFKPNAMSQHNLLRFKHALAKKIIKKSNK